MIVEKIVQNYIFLLLIFYFQKEQLRELNVVNNTKFVIEELNIYSQEFKDLKPKDSTANKLFLFDELTHNSIIHLKSQDKYFNLYIIMPKFKKSTIVLDSLNIERRAIYYSVLLKK